MKDRNEILNEIIELIPTIMFPEDKPINDDLRLEDDLSIYGDDAIYFIQNYAKLFNVDISSFDYNKYFTKEYSWTFNKVIKFFTGKDFVSREVLILNDLVEAAIIGKLV